MKRTKLLKLLLLFLLLGCQGEELPPEPEQPGLSALLRYKGSEPLLKRLSRSLAGDERAQEALKGIIQRKGSPEIRASFVDRRNEDLRGTATSGDEGEGDLLVIPLVPDHSPEVGAILTYTIAADSSEYLKLYSMETLSGFTGEELISEEVRTLPLTFLAVQYQLNGIDQVKINDVVFKRKEDKGSTSWTIVKECQDWAIYVGDDPEPVTGTNCEYEIEVEEDTAIEIEGEGSGSGSGSEVAKEDTTQASKPCPGDPVKNPEVAPQTATGIMGGMYGCARNGTGCTEATATTKAKKHHKGIDLKNDYGDAIYAMYGGTVYSSRYSKKAGWFVRVQSTVKGKTFLTEYFHLQKEKRVTSGSVKAGDIIGYQGDSGNLKGAIQREETVSHVHIQVREHDGSKKWGFENYTVVEPLDYLETEISATGEVIQEADCATDEQVNTEN